MKDNAISIEKAGGMSEEELAGKIVTGVFCDKEKLEFTDKYQKIIDSVSGGAK
ncbi:MAG TPA: hypothetical protein PLW37_09685 [bacterium]|nr:hypothetical protein [bacterium]